MIGLPYSTSSSGVRNAPNAELHTLSKSAPSTAVNIRHILLNSGTFTEIDRSNHEFKRHSFVGPHNHGLIARIVRSSSFEDILQFIRFERLAVYEKLPLDIDIDEEFFWGDGNGNRFARVGQRHVHLTILLVEACRHEKENQQHEQHVDHRRQAKRRYRRSVL